MHGFVVRSGQETDIFCPRAFTKEKEKVLPPRTSYWKSDSEKFVRATLPTAWTATENCGAFNIDGIAEMKTTIRRRAKSLCCQVNGRENSEQKFQ